MIATNLNPAVDFDRTEPLGEFTLTTFSFSEWATAVADYPEGAECGWCGAPNFWCDDCGFFVIAPRGNDCRPTCEKCFRGPEGQAHVARYGMGDR
jgi:hypothetical protein